MTEAAGDWAGWLIFGFCFAAVSGDSSLRLRVSGGVVAICGDETVAWAAMTEVSVRVVWRGAAIGVWVRVTADSPTALLRCR